MPAPEIPHGVFSISEFGQKIMRWGTGHEQARARIQTLTLAELNEQGVTLRIARLWHNFYINEAIVHPRNPSAAGRADLMSYAVELLETDDE